MELDIIRELNCYQKMFEYILLTIEECGKICTDSFVKEQLIKVQQEVEDIRSGDEYKNYSFLTADEKTVALLLSFIIDKEVSKDSDNFDSDTFSNALHWFLTMKGENIKLSDEEIDARIAEIFRIAEEEKRRDSSVPQN